MAKLSLREKIKFWEKNRIWLKEISNFNCKNAEMTFYKGENSSIIWGYGLYEGKFQIIQISERENDWSDYCYSFYNKQEMVAYIFGKKGIFAKVDEESSWKCIYSELNIEGMVVNPSQGRVFIFRKNGKADAFTIKDGYIQQVSGFKNKEIVYINGIGISKNYISYIWGTMNILVFNENDTYGYYYVTAENFDDSNISFKTLQSSYMFLNGMLIKGYSLYNKTDVLLTLSKGRVKIHHYLDKYNNDNFIELRDGFYVADLAEDHQRHLLRSVNNDTNVKDLGVVPEGKYSFIEEKLGVFFFKVRNKEGITLIATKEDDIQKKFYKNATDIKISKPVILKGGNAMELKPIVVYEKVIES